MNDKKLRDLKTGAGITIRSAIQVGTFENPTDDECANTAICCGANDKHPWFRKECADKCQQVGRSWKAWVNKGCAS